MISITDKTVETSEKANDFTIVPCKRIEKPAEEPIPAFKKGLGFITYLPWDSLN
jgi:hypothetical protein